MQAPAVSALKPPVLYSTNNQQKSTVGTNPLGLPQAELETMLLGIDGGRNDPCLKHTLCPRCKARGRFVYHSSYHRKLLCLDEDDVTVKTLVIDRVKCKSCKTTHVCLPIEAVAHSSLSIQLCLAALASTQSIERTCERLLISVRTYYRISAHSARLSVAARLHLVIIDTHDLAALLVVSPFCREVFSRVYAALYCTTPSKTSDYRRRACLHALVQRPSHKLPILQFKFRSYPQIVRYARP